MTELFTRQGSPHTGPVIQTAEGPVYSYVDPCHRCGGPGGSDAWKFTGWVCYRCNGRGTEGRKVAKLYTADQLLKLNATAEKKAANRAAKAAIKAEKARAEVEAAMAPFLAEHGALLASADPYLDRNDFLRSVVTRARETGYLSEKQIAAIQKIVAACSTPKLVGQHVGTAGERVEVEVEIVRINSYPSSFGGAFHIVSMKTPAGDTLVSKGKFQAESGERLRIKATVKSHGEFRDEPQTQVERVAVVERLSDWSSPVRTGEEEAA